MSSKAHSTLYILQAKDCRICCTIKIVLATVEASTNFGKLLFSSKCNDLYIILILAVCFVNY